CSINVPIKLLSPSAGAVLQRYWDEEISSASKLPFELASNPISSLKPPFAQLAPGSSTAVTIRLVRPSAPSIPSVPFVPFLPSKPLAPSSALQDNKSTIINRKLYRFGKKEVFMGLKIGMSSTLKSSRFPIAIMVLWRKGPINRLKCPRLGQKSNFYG